MSHAMPEHPNQLSPREPSAKSSTSGYESLNRLMSLMTGDEKHGASATSTLDVIWTLYDRVMNINPSNLRDPQRDRFVLSKGHAPWRTTQFWPPKDCCHKVAYRRSATATLRLECILTDA
jgi:hypothetical protein